jgi:hypothetical protein
MNTKKFEVDLTLIHEANKISNGQTVHLLNNKLTTYSGFAQLYNETFIQKYLDKTKEVESEIRSILIQERMKIMSSIIY